MVASFEITGIAVLAGERSRGIAQATFTLDGYAGLVEPSPDEIAAARAWLPDDLAPELLAYVEDLLFNLDIEDRSVYLRFSGDIQSAAAAVAAVATIAVANLAVVVPGWGATKRSPGRDLRCE